MATGRSHPYGDLISAARAGGLPVMGTGTGRNNQLYAARTAADGPVVVKLHRAQDRADREARALRRHAGSGFTPRLLHVERSPIPAVVMSRLDGVPLGDRPLTGPQSTALAEVLEKIYRRPVDGGPPVATPAEQMVRRVRSAYRGRPAREHAARLWARWDAGGGPELLMRPRIPIFGRGDPNLANCLWDGQMVRLVDWEYSGITDRAYELADLVEHPASRSTLDAAWDTFVARFDLTADEQPRYCAARAMLALFWVQRLPGDDHQRPRFLERAARAVGKE